jgi:hypothetical protein
MSSFELLQAAKKESHFRCEFLEKIQ